MLTRLAILAVLATLPLGASGDARPAIGEPAPALSLPDTHGATHTLEQYRGSWVVLEWVNYGCPYVVKHYRSGNIPSQQARWTEQGVVWLAIVSSPPGAQGHYEPAEMNVQSERMGSRASAVLLDPSGTVGRAYDARTTPHMFIIDPDGRVAYMGGIDDIATARESDLENATQYVDRALRQALAGEPIAEAVTRPYGCAIRYRQ